MNMKNYCTKPYKNRFNKGFITSYVLYGIGLLAATGFAISAMSRNGSEQKISHQIREDLVSQAGMIRNKLIMCSLLRSNGANTTDSSSQSFPRASANPAITTVDLQVVNCIDAADPSSGGTGNLWSMGDGVTIPKNPNSFARWQYTNNGTDVFISIDYSETVGDRSGAILDSAVKRLGEGMAVNQTSSKLIVYLKKA
jgi:hypothetical protein